MKIEYDLTNERFKYYNSAFGIFMRKRILKKHPNKRILSFTTIGIIYLILTILIFFIGAIFIAIFHLDKYIDFFTTIISILFVTILFYFTYFFVVYISLKKNISKGSLIIDKDGISDISDNKLTVKFDWEKIDFIVIKENEIVIISDYLQIISKTQDKEKLINTIKKYSDDVLVIIR